MAIEICTVCYNFQRRWALQLASLIQQIEPPDFLINIAYVDGNGNPDVKTVVNFYEQKGLQFKLTPYDETLKTRGFIRNLQVQNSSEEWLFFNDCDLIYHPHFFGQIKIYLDPSSKELLGFNPLAHTNIETANRFFDNFQMYVSSAYDVAKSFGITKVTGRGIVNGGGQLVRRQVVLNKCKGHYVRSDYSNDRPMGFNGTRSDIRFRRKFRRRRVISDMPMNIHAEHYRMQNNGILNPKFDINAQR